MFTSEQNSNIDDIITRQLFDEIDPALSVYNGSSSRTISGLNTSYKYIAIDNLSGVSLENTTIISKATDGNSYIFFKPTSTSIIIKASRDIGYINIFKLPSFITKITTAGKSFTYAKNISLNIPAKSNFIINCYGGGLSIQNSIKGIIMSNKKTSDYNPLYIGTNVTSNDITITFCTPNTNYSMYAVFN